MHDGAEDDGRDQHPDQPDEHIAQWLERYATGMAVTVDIGNTKNIHPTNKQEVGKRLALWALAKTYGRLIAWAPVNQKAGGVPAR
jgi:hypothetical protein